jgi:hypothetical protein
VGDDEHDGGQQNGVHHNLAHAFQGKVCGRHASEYQCGTEEIERGLTNGAYWSFLEMTQGHAQENHQDYRKDDSCEDI